MTRTPASALYWRLLGINGLIFTVGTAVLAVAPVTVSSLVLLRELPVLVIGLVVMMAANAVLLRASLAPLEGLTALMARLDTLRSGDRVVLRVADDGDGPPTRVGAGIHGMRERAMLVGARLTIGPADGGGTEVRLVVPPRGVPPRRPG